MQLENNRLEQELVLMAQRIDVAEELDRLEAHVKETYNILKKKEAVGRRLDFMMRKDGRMYCLEANTLPGMTPTSLLPQEAQVLGISYPELCELLIQLSLRKRGNNA